MTCRTDAKVSPAPGNLAGSPAILVSASDPRGYIYGLLKLAERVQFNHDAHAALHLQSAIEEEPENRVRSVSRYFCSEIENKPCYYDRRFWPAYLHTLIGSRFNRFGLGFGLAYDFPRGVTDD